MRSSRAGSTPLALLLTGALLAGCAGGDEDPAVVATTTTVAPTTTAPSSPELETGPAEPAPPSLPPEIEAVLPTSIEISGRWAGQGTELAVGSAGADATAIVAGAAEAFAALGPDASGAPEELVATAPAWCSAVTPSTPWTIRVAPPAVTATIGGFESAELVLDAAPPDGGDGVGTATFEIDGERLQGPVEVTPAAVAAAGTFVVDLGEQGRLEGAYRCLSA
jgi:hypothetical protein